MTNLAHEAAAALADLTAARERLERLLAERAGPDPFRPSDFRAAFNNVVELDAIEREEARAEKSLAPSTADLFGDTLAAAFAHSRQTADALAPEADDLTS